MFRLFQMNRELRVLQNRRLKIEKQTGDIEEKIKKAEDPAFVEKELQQRLDYVGEEDLIFIFPENL